VKAWIWYFTCVSSFLVQFGANANLMLHKESLRKENGWSGQTIFFVGVTEPTTKIASKGSLKPTLVLSVISVYILKSSARR